MKCEYDKLKIQTEEATKERCDRDGVDYLPGMGMAGGYTEEEIDAANKDGATTAGKRKRAPATACNACGGSDHRRVTSKKCPKHQEWKKQKTQQKKASTSRDMLERDSMQQAAMDALPFTDDIKDEDEDDSGSDVFFDAVGLFTNDEDGSEDDGLV